MSSYKGRGHDDFFRRRNADADDFSGRLYGIYHARVIENVDPDKQGRIKVRFHWLEEEDAPEFVSGWIGQHSNTGLGPTNLERGRNFGMDWPLPEVGSLVSIYFNGGDIHDAWYFGAPRYQEGNTGVPDLEKDDKRDWSFRLALQNGFEFGVDTEGNCYFNIPGNLVIKGQGNSVTISCRGEAILEATDVTVDGKSVLKLRGVTIDQTPYPRPEEVEELRDRAIEMYKGPPGREDPGIKKIPDLE